MDHQKEKKSCLPLWASVDVHSDFLRGLGHNRTDVKEDIQYN